MHTATHRYPRHSPSEPIYWDKDSRPAPAVAAAPLKNSRQVKGRQRHQSGSSALLFAQPGSNTRHQARLPVMVGANQLAEQPTSHPIIKPPWTAFN